MRFSQQQKKQQTNKPNNRVYSSATNVPGLSAVVKSPVTARAHTHTRADSHTDPANAAAFSRRAE